MKIKLLVFLALLTIHSYSYSSESKTGKTVWSCHMLYGKVNVLWLVEMGDDSYIKVFEEKIPTKYEMSGLEKRWYWELDENNTYTYEVTLGPDREAEYYDFSTSKDRASPPRETYECIK